MSNNEFDRWIRFCYMWNCIGWAATLDCAYGGTIVGPALDAD